MSINLRQKGELSLVGTGVSSIDKTAFGAIKNNNNNDSFEANTKLVPLRRSPAYAESDYQVVEASILPSFVSLPSANIWAKQAINITFKAMFWISWYAMDPALQGIGHTVRHASYIALSRMSAARVSVLTEAASVELSGSCAIGATSVAIPVALFVVGGLLFSQFRPLEEGTYNIYSGCERSSPYSMTCQPEYSTEVFLAGEPMPLDLALSAQ